MFSIDNVNQHIDWWHEPILNSEETFEHKGTLSSVIFSPNITIGLSNYWNMTINTKIGTRIMTWDGPEKTKHHRNESTFSNFHNAVGGLLGDSQILFRYLLYNDGQGSGKRLFIGGGLKVPSKNTLTEDPFFLDGSMVEEHRHFGLSEGVYKGVFESQFYKKRNKNPVFIGGSVILEHPLKENRYGYKGSPVYNLSINALSKQLQGFHSSIGGNISLSHTSRAYWNNLPAPNSISTILTIGVSATLNANIGVVGVGFQRPIFLVGGFAATSAEDIDQDISAIQATLSFRRMLDFVVPWLDPLKDL